LISFSKMQAFGLPPLERVLREELAEVCIPKGTGARRV
jgi:hypothetical protein